MKLRLPVDFREKVRNPPAPAGNGYPYRISADDLMKNFEFILEQLNESPGRVEQYYAVKNGVLVLANLYTEGYEEV